MTNRLLVIAAVVTLALATTGGPGAHAAGTQDPQAAPWEYGIVQAMSGQVARAESVFVFLLSRSPCDPRALNNLGNLRLLEGELDLALTFYGRAMQEDGEDAGIRLNRATTLMLLGDLQSAEEEAARAVDQAGGTEQAAALLGLLPESGGREAGGADRPPVSKDEIRALLRAAAAKVPGDSSSAPAAADTTGMREKAKNRVRTWRSAGPRAGDQGDLAASLYWKR